MSDRWECGPHTNRWNGHDARCRRVPAGDRGRCGHTMPGIFGGPGSCCTLLAGHTGWHHDSDTKAEWTTRYVAPTQPDRAYAELHAQLVGLYLNVLASRTRWAQKTGPEARIRAVAYQSVASDLLRILDCTDRTDRPARAATAEAPPFPRCWCLNRAEGQEHEHLPGHGIGLCPTPPVARDTLTDTEPESTEVSPGSRCAWHSCAHRGNPFCDEHRPLADRIHAITVLADQMQRDDPSWRRGQAMFNALYELYPGTANRIRGTVADPFFRDSRLPAFHRALADGGA